MSPVELGVVGGMLVGAGLALILAAAVFGRLRRRDAAVWRERLEVRSRLRAFDLDDDPIVAAMGLSVEGSRRR
jgi:hypothetical protein